MYESTSIFDKGETLERGYVIERQGLRFTRELSLEELEDLGRALVASDDTLQWAIGDWLVVVGKLTIPVARSKKESAYQWAVRVTGLNPDLLSTYWRVASGFPPDSRYAALRWSIHKEALRLRAELRGEFLLVAREKKFTLLEASQYIDEMDTTAKRNKNRGVPGTGKVRKGDTPRAMVRCPHCQQEFLIKGNKIDPTDPERRTLNEKKLARTTKSQPLAIAEA